MTPSAAVPTPAHLDHDPATCATAALGPGLTDLRAALEGGLILPGELGYEERRRGWSRNVDRRPALIVQAVTARDVSAAIHFSRRHQLPLAVRSGGHSVAAHSQIEGGVLIDLGLMTDLDIDVESGTAWAGAGLRARDVTVAAFERGLALSFGDTGSVGIGGLTLGGGIGFLVRKHGLTIDSLLAVEVVTADGTILVASAEEHPDLFWGLRGGGANLGVATRFRYQLNPISTVLGGMLILPATADVVERSMRIAEQAPDALTIIGNLMKLPPMPFVDPAFHGQVGWAIQLVWAGDHAEGTTWVDQLRALATPIADLVGPMPYPGIYAFNEEAEPAAPGVTRSTFLRTIDTPMLERLIELAGASTAPVAIVQLRVLGGAMARVPADATAFAHRAEPYLAGVFAMFPDLAERDRHLAWANAAMAAMVPASSGVYVNFLEAEGNARIRQAYPDGAFERLAEIKRRYDPDNVFRSNQNITSAV